MSKRKIFIWWIAVPILVLILLLGAWFAMTYWCSIQKRKVFYTHTKLWYFKSFLDKYYKENKDYPASESIEGLLSTLKPKYVDIVRRIIIEDYGGRPYPDYYKQYLEEITGTDAWGRPLRYEAWPKENRQNFRIGSAGSDGIWSYSDLRDYKIKVTNFFENYSFKDDIVIGNEGLVQGTNCE